MVLKMLGEQMQRHHLLHLPFKPEEATTFEMGAKMNMPENNLRFNAAYFSTDYKDMQVSAFNGSTFIVSNAAEAEITGFEVDTTWAPTDSLIIGGSITTLDFAYGSFICSLYRRSRCCIQSCQT